MTRYAIVEDVLARPLGTDVVLFHPESERLLMLRETGPRIWELLSEEKEIDEIVTRLALEFDGTESTIRQHLTEFLSRLEQEGILARQD